MEIECIHATTGLIICDFFDRICIVAHNKIINNRLFITTLQVVAKSPLNNQLRSQTWSPKGRIRKFSLGVLVNKKNLVGFFKKTTFEFKIHC